MVDGDADGGVADCGDEERVMFRMADLSFSGDSLDSLSTDLRESALLFRIEVDKTVAEVGAEVAETARGLAGSHSSSIPPTIKLEMIPGAAVIKAGNEAVPLAALYELGNKGKGGSKSETFRHPTFGHDPYVDQKRYPFLRPALALDRRAITKRMEKAWDNALQPLTRSDD